MLGSCRSNSWTRSSKKQFCVNFWDILATYTCSSRWSVPVASNRSSLLPRLTQLRFQKSLAGIRVDLQLCSAQSHVPHPAVILLKRASRQSKGFSWKKKEEKRKKLASCLAGQKAWQTEFCQFVVWLGEVALITTNGAQWRHNGCTWYQQWYV